jgi:hypothetical protein
MGKRGACVLLSAIAWLTPDASTAQTPSSFYAGGSIGAFSVSADDVDGRSMATGVFSGARLKPWLDIEGELVLPADDFTRSHTGVSVSFAPPGSSREEFDRLGVLTRFDTRRHVASSISLLAVFHPPATGRWVPALIAGVTNHRVHERRTYTPIAVPDGVDPNHPSVRAREERSTRNLGGPTIGASLAFMVTRHLAVVPDVRFDYGSIGDEINNALRTSVRLLWRF